MSRLKGVRALLIALLTGIAAALALLVTSAPSATAASLTQVTNFGSNPGGLQMYIYVPDSHPANPAIVVAMHGCGGSGPGFYQSSEFASLADQYGFIVIYPTATKQTAMSNCFDVWSPDSKTHSGASDPASIVSMVTYTEQQYGGDPQRVYATGSSSGGQETNALLADYPDVFAAGSVFMGVPFTCFADAADFPPQTSKCVNGSMNKTPQVWGDAVRQAYPGFTGTRPRVQLWHGTADTLVPYSLLQEEVDQWTDVHGLSQTPTSTDQPGSGWNRQSFADAGGTVKVEAITVQGAGHVLPLSGMAAKAIAFFGLDQSNGGTTGGTTTGGDTGGTTGGTPPSGATCSATFTVVNAWPGGYQADVTVKNTGSSPLSGWLVTWTQPSGQTITSLWNATQGTSGSSTTARNVGYNGTVAAGATTAFGYTVSGGAPQAGMPMTCQAS